MLTKKVSKTFLPKEFPMMMLWGMVGGFATYTAHQYCLPGVYDKLQLAVIVMTVGLFAGASVLMPVPGLVLGIVYFFGGATLFILTALNPEWVWTGGQPGNVIADAVVFALSLVPALFWKNKKPA